MGYKIKSIYTSVSGITANYTRLGTILPKEVVIIEKLKDLFTNTFLTEEKILLAIQADPNIQIEEVSQGSEVKAEVKKDKKGKEEYLANTSAIDNPNGLTESEIETSKANKRIK